MSDLRAHLTSLYVERGQLTPQDVVDDARPTDSPLHHRFEWNDALAGEAYRRVQAQQLIRSVKISFPESAPVTERRSVRAFSSVRGGDKPETEGYAPTEEVIANDFGRKVLLRDLEREIASLKRKYGHLKEFAALMTEAVSA
ncbi:hypothetical protein [Gordonia sp. N1V]|uniref:hypothetical protein n=1 Tax=Gordonia sp. N1V TaxID=3034163 RepID=UPI0023E1C535|nr:hypothetical protein [Gordonia sp. N1V]MDF3280445.1 hypothetical protein [Gordonia sp. N1V]